MAREQIASLSESGDPILWAKAAEMLAGDLKAKLLDDEGVRRALARLEEKIQRNGSIAASTYEVLLWAACAVQKRDGRSDWEKFFAAGTGKSWKCLTEFPERVRRMARQIDKLLRHGFYGREKAREFHTLTSKLNSYADWLNSQLEQTPVSPRRAASADWIVHLSLRVKALTGRFYDEEVADLLNVVNWRLNGEGDCNKGFEAQTLRDHRSRLKARRLKCFYGQ